MFTGSSTALRPALRSTLGPSARYRAASARRALPASSMPRFASSSAGNDGLLPGTPRARTRLLVGLSLLLPVAYYFAPKKQPLNPATYSDHQGSVQRCGPAHVLLTVPVDESERAQFGSKAWVEGPYGSPPRLPPREGQSREEGEEGRVVVQHVMVKNPSLMIERPYTPVNDVEAEGEIRMVVKRVRGGEVGRLVHGLQAGDKVGLRGPVTTLALHPANYDTIVMVSTGTAVAPFLQLLAKAPAGETKYKLLHQLPAPSPSRPTNDDWTVPFIEPLKARLGERLEVSRIAPGAVDKNDMLGALKGSGRVLVLVCLPPSLMRPLCGPLSPTLTQGPLTGLLAQVGLRPHQVWKLE